MVLEVPNEIELEKLLMKANKKGIVSSLFKEPDLSDQLTAVVLEPGLRSKRLCSSLPLALNN